MAKKIKKTAKILKCKNFLLVLSLVLALGLGFLLAFLAFYPRNKTIKETASSEKSKTSLLQDQSHQLESRWIHPANSAYEGTLELWKDGSFTFKGFNSPDFSSGGQWKFDSNLLILTFTQDTDYWQGMFKASEAFVDYYDEVVDVTLAINPSVTMDIYKCTQLMGKSCFNFFNWYFYEEKDLDRGQSRSKDELQQQQMSEKEAVWEAVYDYAPKIDMMSPSLDFELDKIVGNYALVQVIPGGNAEGAALILEKIEGQWIVQDFGTYFPEWEEKVPELFQW